MDKGMLHAAEFRRCLETLDIKGIRRLWKHVSPHLPQPKNDADALHAMHEARVRMKRLSPRARQYSEEWLAERARGIAENAVGIAVKATSIASIGRAKNMHQAMHETVLDCVKVGIDLDKDAKEVSRRMNIARAKA